MSIERFNSRSADPPIRLPWRGSFKQFPPLPRLTHKERADANLGPKGPIAFARFAEDHYLPKDARRRQGDRTYQRELDVIKALNSYFGQLPIHTIDREPWDDFQSLRMTGELGRKCSPGGVLKEYKTFRRVIKYAVALKFLRANPFADLKPRELGVPRRDEAETLSAVAIFLSAVRVMFRSPRSTLPM